MVYKKNIKETSKIKTYTTYEIKKKQLHHPSHFNWKVWLNSKWNQNNIGTNATLRSELYLFLLFYFQEKNKDGGSIRNYKQEEETGFSNV